MIFTADDRGVEAAASCLRAGGVIGIPTDTVYGIAVLADLERPAERLAAAKGRPLDQPAILMGADVGQLAPYVRWTAAATALARRHWPGPLTLIVPATAAGLGLGGRGTVGVRIPACPLVRRLFVRVGPCATTSANRHGEPPATDAAAALSALPMLAGALEGPAQAPGAPAHPSSILDCTGARPVLLRVGALDAAALGVAEPEGGATGSG